MPYPNPNNLKPCPFCESDHILEATRKPVSSSEYYVIKCFDCSAEITRSTMRKAIEAWNRRPETILVDHTESHMPHGIGSDESGWTYRLL